MQTTLGTICRLTSFVAALLWFATYCQAQTEVSALARIERSGTVHVGYIPTPGTFAFRDSSGETVGYSIDVCRKVVEGIRKTLGRSDLRMDFKPLEAAQRIPMLKAGISDIECGGNTNVSGQPTHVDSGPAM